MGLRFAHDLFRCRKTIDGAQIQEYQGNLSDDACSLLRYAIIDQFGFDVGKEATRDAAETLAIENATHPIRDYLDSLSWDGMSRLDRWMTTYLGADDTPLNATIGRIVLIAAVRRVRQPGVKFDTILVLEGEQGVGKSTAIRILAGPENFSDQNILTLDPKAQMELLEGVWIYELCELEGLSRADTSKVKAFASRSIDQGRPAYGRFKETRPRQVVFIGTTNEDKYLRDMTGNRRFWPVRVDKIELGMLERDRDQLFAEATREEQKGESLVLPEALWPVAQTEQQSRLEDDPWVDILSDLDPSNLDQVAGAVELPA
jgi:predicted P-loop ATPase